MRGCHPKPRFAPSILAFDLLGQEMGVSCVELLGGRVRDRVPAYDTTLFFQDMLNPEKGAGQVAADAAKSHSDGYTGFKIKVGRPGRWMTPEVGVERDAEVVLAVREAVGPDARIMVDANFGYDGRLDLLEDFIRETLPANLFWMEEMVSADLGDYRAMRRVRDRLGSNALLVCGEVDTDPPSPVFRDLVNTARLSSVRRKDGRTFPVVVAPQPIARVETGEPVILCVLIDLGEIHTARPMGAPENGLAAELASVALKLQSLSFSAAVASEGTFPADHPLLRELSAREREVLGLLARGTRVPAIGKELFISQNTVRNHLKAIYRKVDVSSQSALIELVRSLGAG